MKKVGDRKAAEQARFVFAHLLFILLITLSISFVLKTEKNSHITVLTGYAAYDEADAKAMIETAFDSASYLDALGNSNLCIMIKEGDGVEAFSVRKTADSTLVIPTYEMCSGRNTEDIIVKFNSYEDFLSIMENPSPENIVRGTGGNKFYILESRFVQQGGDVLCNAQFKERYCGAANSLSSPEALITGDLACCLGELTESQQRLLDEHLKSGEFEEESIVQPTPTIFSVGNIVAFAILVTVVFVVVSSSITKRKKKKVTLKKAEKVLDEKLVELKKYVHGTLDQGYSATQIMEHLKAGGWEERVLQNMFMEIHHERHISKSYKK